MAGGSQHQPRSGHQALAHSLMRKTVASYAIALLLVASLATASFFLLNSVISANVQKAALIELGARQQLLTQRMLTAATEAQVAHVQWTRTTARQNLRVALNEFLANERLMLNGSSDPRSPLYGLELSDSALQMFNEPPGQIRASTDALRSTVDAFLNELPTQVGSNESSEAVTYYTALKLYVVEKSRREYDNLTRLFSSEAAEKGAIVEKVHITVFVMTLLLLVAEALLIFRPLVRRVVSGTSELLAARDQMAFAANHDALTGLYNRAFLKDFIGQALAGARRRGERMAVIRIDLDHFKDVNDTFGHAAGDAVLVETARRLVASLRESDVCVRVGGDEFTVILNDLGDGNGVIEVAARIIAALKEPLEFSGAQIRPSASAGVAMFSEDATDIDEVMVNADLALYQAKADGRGSYRLFGTALRAMFEERTKVERELREAIAAEAFDVHFQPQVSLYDGHVIGVEALVRWQQAGRAVSPAEFLPVAEKAGLMPGLGRIVFDKAIRTAVTWRRAGIEFGSLALNVSGQELREPDFAAYLLSTLRRKGLPTRMVALEVVESVMLDDDEHGIRQTLNQLRRAGIRLELDDFGTGYASLSHISAKQIDRLKIDRRFVRGIDKNAANSKIVKAIVELSRGLSIAVVAEGAESEVELACLRQLGCPAVQGYGIALPMPADQTALWLTSRRSAARTNTRVA